jgi:hypothetical protein
MSKINSQYEEAAVLRDPDGVVCVITRRTNSEMLSFMFCKEFERDGQIVRTGYLNRRHTTALRRLVAKVEEWLDQEVERAGARVAGIR